VQRKENDHLLTVTFPVMLNEYLIEDSHLHHLK